MIKKVKVDKLKPGAFIADFNCSWIAHPFLVSKKRIRSYRDIEKIKQSGIREVYIDTTKGIDITDTISKEELIEYFNDPQFAEFSRHDLDFEVQISLKQELKKAIEIKNKAYSIIQQAFHDAKYGNSLKLQEITGVVTEIVESISRNQNAMLLLSNIKDKDEYTFEHSMNVSVLTAGLCKALKMPKEEIIEYTFGSILHDIGKSRIPDEILQKQQSLTPSEFELMKKHVELGVELVKDKPEITGNMIAFVAEHHERENGTGYPRKLKGEQISQAGKIGAIVDVYDALTTNRVYHSANHPSEVIKDMYLQRGLLFDEELLEQFILFTGIYPPGSLVKLDHGYLAIVIESPKENLLRPKVRLIYDYKKNITIVPRNLDLAYGIGEYHKIIGLADPAYYKIDITKYLLQFIHS